MRKTWGIFLLTIITTLNLAACGRMPATDTNESVSMADITSGSAIPVSDPAADALQAYSDILSQEEYQNNNEDKIMGTHFAISDLNTDGIPELLISDDHNMLSLSEYYTYENGAVTELKGPAYPQLGGLYVLPSRNTYAFFRGGPAWTDEEDGNNYMPYTLQEYTLNLEEHQIHGVNYADWVVCNSGSKAGSTECESNGKSCPMEDIINQYSLKIAKTEEDWYRYYLPDEEDNYIELIPNTDANRKAIVADTDSDDKEIDTDPDSDGGTDNSDS